LSLPFCIVIYRTGLLVPRRSWRRGPARVGLDEPAQRRRRKACLCWTRRTRPRPHGSSTPHLTTTFHPVRVSARLALQTSLTAKKDKNIPLKWERWVQLFHFLNSRNYFITLFAHTIS
jgi:hypothetical protein